MSAPFHESVWMIPFSVFVAGLIGSPHCMSMCGPIVVNFAQNRARLFAYQTGRMLTYVTAGAIGGSFGQSVLGTTRPEWLSNLTLGTIAALLIINGYRAFRGHPLHIPLPIFLKRLSSHAWKVLRLPSLPPIASAGLAGALTVFLPCGHLYSFLLGAVATGSALGGAIFMFAFWLGSAPLLSVSGHWLQKLLRPKIPGAQRWAGIILVSAGILSIALMGARSHGLLGRSHQQHEGKTSTDHPHKCH